MLEEVIAILASTPKKIAVEVGTLTPRQMRSRPAPGKWSVQEILAHLDDGEDIMRARVARMLEHDEPALPRFDQERRAIELHYDRKDPRRTLERFARQRRGSVKWLRTVRPAQLNRKGRHEVVGVITAGEMIHEWAFHDLGHLKQILEVKRYALWPDMGNMRQFYKLT